MKFRWSVHVMAKVQKSTIHQIADVIVSEGQKKSASGKLPDALF